MTGSQDSDTGGCRFGREPPRAAAGCPDAPASGRTGGLTFGEAPVGDPGQGLFAARGTQATPLARYSAAGAPACGQVRSRGGFWWSTAAMTGTVNGLSRDWSDTPISSVGPCPSPATRVGCPVMASYQRFRPNSPARRPISCAGGPEIRASKTSAARSPADKTESGVASLGHVATEDLRGWHALSGIKPPAPSPATYPPPASSATSVTPPGTSSTADPGCPIVAPPAPVRTPIQ